MENWCWSPGASSALGRTDRLGAGGMAGRAAVQRTVTTAGWPATPVLVPSRALPDRSVTPGKTVICAPLGNFAFLSGVIVTVLVPGSNAVPTIPVALVLILPFLRLLT